jgi:hypothetical protein
VRKEVGNEHTQSIRAGQSGGGETETKADFWEEQELGWGVDRNPMSRVSQGNQLGGETPISARQIQSRLRKYTNKPWCKQGLIAEYLGWKVS